MSTMTPQIDIADFVRQQFCEAFGLTADEVTVLIDDVGNIAVSCEPRAPMQCVRIDGRLEARST